MEIGSMTGGMDIQAMRDMISEKVGSAVSEYDADGSGSLSLEEFTELGESKGANNAGDMSAEEAFAEIDTDGDGEISSDEMSAHIQANAPTPQMSGETGMALTMLQESMNSSESSSLLDSLLEQLESSSDDDEDESETESV